MIGEDLLRTDPGSEFAQDQLHRDTRTADHRLAAHDLGVDLDPRMRQAASSCADYNAQCSTLVTASPPYLGLGDVLWPAGEEAARLHRILDRRQPHGAGQPRVAHRRDLLVAQCPHEAQFAEHLHVLFMRRSTAPPSAEPPPMPYFAMKSKARSEPLWIGCEHSTGSRFWIFFFFKKKKKFFSERRVGSACAQREHGFRHPVDHAQKRACGALR